MRILWDSLYVVATLIGLGVVGLIGVIAYVLDLISEYGDKKVKRGKYW